jgi:hypothetical protein
MIRGTSTALAIAALAALAAPAAAQQNVQVVEENGIRYQVTTQVTQKAIPETKWVPSETTQVRPQYTTEMQDSVRTYQVPITEQQWVPGYQRTWNLLAPPVLSYRLMPVTRWETRTETVKVPVTKVAYIPYKHVQHIPVTNTRIANETHTSRVAIGVVPGASPGTAVASTQPQQSLQSLDPPAANELQAPEDPYTATQPTMMDRRK